MLYEFDGKEPVSGKDTYVSELAQVIGDVVIGDNCYIGHGAILRGDYGRIEIGSGTAVEEGAIIHAPPANVHTIGENVTVGHGAILHGAKIEDFAVIGMGAILSLWSEIGEWAIVAEGAVVTMKQTVPGNVVFAGNPAQFVRDIKDKDKNMWTMGKKIYVDLAKKQLHIGMRRIGG
ncbi:MAG: gamma carbonic anhydrase family protein [bacterium]|nr:gamma carbonic anhydrase family protein [bacterium]